MRLPLVAACCLALVSSLRPQQSNVLILLADDLGVDAVGAYGEGADPAPTPNIDALAERGVLFRNCWANPLCSPSRALIHTGRYAFRTGVGTVVTWNGLGTPLPFEEITLPELLDIEGSGYAHAAIGKWHLSTASTGGLHAPNLAGWSHFAGQVSNPASYTSWLRTVNGVSAPCTAYMTTQNVDDALAWIQSVPEPWVCYLAFFAAHSPYHAPPRHLHTQSLEGKIPSQDPIPYFKAMVQAMDTEIGRLLGTLGPDVVSRTNIIFMGDNGTDWRVTEPPFIPTHGKETVYEGGLNVPLIVAGPIVGSPGREETALVGAVDLYPTVAELCGVTQMPRFVKIDGVSFARCLRGPSQAPPRTTIYAELFAAGGAGPAAIRGITYKLIRRFALNPPVDELYDLRADPFELNDLLLGPLTPEEQAAYVALSEQMTALRDTSGQFEPYGALGCLGSNGYPAIEGSGTPAIGSSFAVSLRDGPQGQPALLLIGASSASWSGLALPFPLSQIGGAPGCLLYASAEITLPTTTSALGDASVEVTVPNLKTLVGATLHHTWLLVDPLAPGGTLGLTTSDAVAARVGSAAP